MHLAGVKTLTIRTASSAEEAKQNIELSLMLDMSSSMVGGKIKNPEGRLATGSSTRS